MNDENSYLQALRDYEKSLHQGVRDPLIFGLKKIFEQTYKEFKIFLQGEELLYIAFISNLDNKARLDEILEFLIKEIKKIAGY